jgi:ATP-dependent helicase/nuclease subunit B
VAGLVLAAALADEEDSRVSGFMPDAFEVEAVGPLEPIGGSDLKGLRVRGRLDRVDRREQPPGLRIVDYKYRHGARKKDEDKNLVLSAVRGTRLQPPLYALMQPSASTVDFVFLAPRGEKTVERASFDPAVLKGEAGKAIAQTVRTLVGGIRQGQYFVLPEDAHCSRCEFTAACRRLHGPTWWRAYIAPQARQLRQLRKQKAGKDGDA